MVDQYLFDWTTAFVRGSQPGSDDLFSGQRAASSRTTFCIDHPSGDGYLRRPIDWRSHGQPEFPADPGRRAGGGGLGFVVLHHASLSARKYFDALEVKS